MKEKSAPKPEFKGLTPNEPVWVAVSGGSDSVCLLRLMVLAGFDCRAVHVNHLLRGADSDADEAFVRDLCTELFVELHVHRERPEKAPSVSLEMAGRVLRHRVFRACLRATPAQAVALGHHLDDNVETIIMRRERQPDDERWDIERDVTIRRGSEALRLFRPLLDWPKDEILNWLEAGGHPFREDRSNQDVSFTRNRIRHKILPNLSLKKRRQMVGTAASAREKDQFFETRARDLLEEMMAGEGLDYEAFWNEPLAVRRKMALAWLGHERASFAMKFARGQVALRDATVSAKVSEMAIKMASAFEQDRLIEDPVALGIPGTTDWGPWTFETELGSGFCAERRPFEAWIRPANAVLVRPWRPGDRMRPFGMTGTRKLQDVLTDLKIPAAQKQFWPVAIDATGEVVWVPGFRIAAESAVAGPDAPSLHLRASGRFVVALREAGFDERGYGRRDGGKDDGKDRGKDGGKNAGNEAGKDAGQGAAL